MADINELNAKLDELQQKLDAKQEKLATAIADFKAHIADLQAQVDAGVKPEQLQASIDKAQTIVDDLESTPTGEDAPPPPDSGTGSTDTPGSTING